MQMKNIVIIGNGISGITAARHIRKMSDCSITVLSGETDHFFSRTALMYIYMGHMKYEHTKPYEDWFWQKNRIELRRCTVTGIDTADKLLQLDDGTALGYDILILAVGSKPLFFSWPGQHLSGVQGFYSFQDLRQMEENTKSAENAVIVGGGLIGVEMAEMLLSRNIRVTFLVRESSFWNNVLPPEESEMVSRHIRHHGVDLRLSTQLQSIEGNGDGRVRGVTTHSGESIPCAFVGLTTGVTPAVDFLKSSDIETGRGVLVNHFFETNISDVYGIGDCAEFREPLPGRKAIEQVWYTGRMHAEAVAQTICGNRTAYKPGVWFNSAKFFDIEYQVYGQVNNQPGPDEDHLYWEHKDGRRAVRIVSDKRSGAVTGINLMGIRYRHAVCDGWIRRKTHVEQVLDELQHAAFDPEFFVDYTSSLRSVYRDQHSEQSMQRG
jgi:NAD(P)H-nitrite reductase large subunit